MDREFEGRTAFVTGGAMGIGGAVAELLVGRAPMSQSSTAPPPGRSTGE